MRSLPNPTFNVEDVLSACISSIRDPILAAELGLVLTAIRQAESDYRVRGRSMTLYAILPSRDIIGILTKTAMMRVYSGTFVRSSRTRHLYDALKAAPQYGICPLCSQRTVSTIDHYLPQTVHANLIVVPLNLVPACAECNKGKLDFQPTCEAEQGFHPYFDNFDDAQWLHAEVLQGTPAALQFSVSTPPNWTPTKASRAERHFRAFRLAELYASHAGVELSNIRFSLELIAEHGSPNDIRAFLADRAESAHRAYLNGWQAATYRALAASDWFCSGGFGS